MYVVRCRFVACRYVYKNVARPALLNYNVTCEHLGWDVHDGGGHHRPDNDRRG